MPRAHQRTIERKPWAPGLWVGESGNAMLVPRNPDNGICVYAIEQTFVVIAEAMRRADQTRLNQKDNT